MERIHRYVPTGPPEIYRTLRRDRPGLPVVIASGYKRDLAADRVGSDICGFVQKPFEPEVLLAAIDEALMSPTRS